MLTLLRDGYIVLSLMDIFQRSPTSFKKKKRGPVFLPRKIYFEFYGIFAHKSNGCFIYPFMRYSTELPDLSFMEKKWGHFSSPKSVRQFVVFIEAIKTFLHF